MSEQLGHTDATTTFRWYARWIPRAGKRVVDALDEVQPVEKLRLETAQGGKVGDQLVTNLESESQIGHSADSEVPDSIGGPSRTRTLDPLIKRTGQDQPTETQDDPSADYSDDHD